MLTNIEAKDNMKAIKCLENRGILLKGTTRKTYLPRREIFQIP